MTTSNCLIVVRREPEGCYPAIVPALSGRVPYGRTILEARQKLHAIAGYIPSLGKHGEEAPWL